MMTKRQTLALLACALAVGSADVMAKLVDPVTLPAETTRERVRAWTTIKTGQ